MKAAICLVSFLTVAAIPLRGQNAPANPPGAGANATTDTPQQNRFWQATVGGGHYMVALDRISSISRHQYVLSGNAVVDEVTVDSLGQALARFYFISPLSDAARGTAAGENAARMVDRGRELVDRAAQIAGTSAQDMVVKTYPDTTHARTIEYRLHSEQELAALYQSLRSAWETGRGRRFSTR